MSPDIVLAHGTVTTMLTHPTPGPMYYAWLIIGLSVMFLGIARLFTCVINGGGSGWGTGFFAVLVGGLPLLTPDPMHVGAQVVRALSGVPPVGSDSPAIPSPAHAPSSTVASATNAPLSGQRAAHIPWAGIVITLGIALTLAIVAVGAVIAHSRVNRMRQHRRETALRNLRRLDSWNWTLETRDQVLAEYGAYETDALLSFRHPLIHDVTCEKTAAFFDAQKATVLVWPNPTPNSTECPLDDDAVAEYRRAVIEMSVAWKAALANAQAVGLDQMPEKYRRNVARAIKVLTMANNPATTAEARANYLRTAMDLVADAVKANVVFVPAKARELPTARPALRSATVRPAPLVDLVK